MFIRKKVLQQAIQGAAARRLAVSALVATTVFSTAVMSNPDSPVVIAGSASFEQMGSQLNITNSPGAIINWNGFSIDRNELTRFLQQNDQSAVLNRVTGSGISNILGELLSNGRVFLVNPNGILVGNGARIDTAGFVGSSLNISDGDFLSGRYKFKGNGGAVVNNGSITAGPGGEVILIAPTVENSGDITVVDGEIILAAGREVTLTSLNDANISFRVSAPGNKALNIGSLTASNGAIGVFANQVMSTGSISANRVTTNARGQIVLQADGSSEIGGTITATGNGVSGGEVTILGDAIRLTSAQIDTTGTNGGKVLVGGEFQGNGDLQRANRTDIDQNSVIHADSLEQGNGGEIIVWSEQATNSQGRLTARGGSVSGDGGLVETSSRGNLQFGQPADVSAANGNPGTWLLDPEDIVIDSAHADSISTALNGGSNVQVKTADTGTGDGNIAVNAPIRKTEGPDAALGLIAHNRIDVNAPIESISGKLSVSLKAGRDIAVNAPVSTNGGSYSANIVPSLLPAEPELENESSGEPDVDADIDSVAEPEEEEANENSESANDSVAAEVTEVIEATDLIELNENGISVDAAVTTNGGDIDINAGENGLLGINDNVTSSGDSAGNVKLLGNQVALYEAANVQASSQTGGGEILIGGDQQGLNPDIANSDMVYIDETASVSADGVGNADGGKIIVFAEDTAIIKGDISAKGGEIGGDGGFVETSGKRSLRVAKAPDASAKNGQSGKWLIDPDTITIQEADSEINVDLSSDGATDTYTSNNDDAIIGVDTIISALAGGTNVEVVTADNSNGTGDINLNADIDLNQRVRAAPAGGLALRAHNDINIRGSIYDSETFPDNESIAYLILEANSDNTNGGGVNIDATGHSAIANSIPENDIEIETIGDITITGEYLNITAGNGVDFEAVSVTAGGALNIDVTGNIEIVANGTSARAEVSARAANSNISAENLILRSTSELVESSLRISGSTLPIQMGTVSIRDTITLDGGRLVGNGNINTENLVWRRGLVGGLGFIETNGEVLIDTMDRTARILKPWNIGVDSVVNWNSGSILLGADINNNGTFLANSDDRVFTDDGDVRINGTFNNNATGEFIKTTSTCDPDCGATTFVSLGGAPLYFDNRGSVRVQEGDLRFLQSRLNFTGDEPGGFRQFAGQTIVEGGNLVTELPLLRNDPPGTIPELGEFTFSGGTLSGGLTDSISEGGEIRGNTTIDGADIAAGQSPGTLNFNGDLTVSSASSFTIELDGTNPGEFDVINVNGTATLNNPTVNVEFLGYTPPNTNGAQDFFDVITARNLIINPGAQAIPLNQPAAIPPNVLPTSGQAGNTFFLAYAFDSTTPVIPEDRPTGTPGVDPELPPGIVRISDQPPGERIPRLPMRPQIDETELFPFDPITPIITLVGQTPDLEDKDDSPKFLQCY